jgi:hypothetical protein
MSAPLTRKEGVYHTHADPAKPSSDRVVNVDRLFFDQAGRLRVLDPTRTPHSLPGGSH